MNSKKHNHLTLEERIVIKTMLLQNKSFRNIAEAIGCNVTTVSREIYRNRIFKTTNSNPSCKYLRVCKKGPNCHLNCLEFEEDICLRITKAPFVCDGCEYIAHCRKNKYRYSPDVAQVTYQNRLTESRAKHQTNVQTIRRIDTIITDLIICKKQSLSHVYATHKEELAVSISTLYRLIDQGKLKVKNIDLPRRVRYRKERTQHYATHVYKHREGRDYQSFLAFNAKHPRANVCEMDTVIGLRSGDHKVLLTILFRSSNFMLIFLLHRKTSKAVVDKFDSLYRKLGFTNFKNLFYIVLTDNGSEMLDVDSLEKGTNKNKKMNLFYCDPRASQQKGKLEKNHQYIRRYLPQGKSFDDLSDLDIIKMVNHINSIPRAQFDNQSPFQMLSRPQRKIIYQLGYQEIPPDEVNLNPLFLMK